MKQNKWFFAVFFIVAVYSIATIFIISSNLRFTTIDAPNHAMFCVQFYGNVIDVLNNSELSSIEKIFAFKDVFSEGIAYWPRLLNLSSLPFIFMFGLSVFSIKMANILYLIVFMIFSYLLALKLGANKKEAIFITTTLPLYPIILRFLQSYGLDIPLMSISVLFFFLLLKTDGFKNTIYSVLAGLALGAGLLIKGQIVIFVLLPTIIYFFSSMFREFKNKDSYIPLFNIFANFILFLILSFHIGELWWKGKYQEMIASLREHTVSSYKHLESDPYEELGSIGYYLFYFKYFCLNGFGAILSAITIIPFFRYIFKRNLPYKKIVLLCLLFSLCMLSCIFRVHQLRYIMPLVPFLVIIITLGSRFKNIFWTIFFRSLILLTLVFRIYLLTVSDKDLSIYSKLFAVENSDRIFNDFGSNNSKIADAFYENFKDYLDPGRYNCLIIRSVSIEDGPLGIQFWLEMKAHENNYRMLTHDLYDQWISAYYWLKDEPGKYIVLSIKNRYEEFKGNSIFDKKWLLKNSDKIFFKATEFKNHPCTKIMLDDFFPILKRDARKMFEFNVNAYYCEVYEYENVPAAY